ncbi:MAG: hypothetical protein KAU20_05025 [Nanoarchaeota archaeon]|nr:hypothetical protein [Nanoarchaeota archaeon]
MVSKKKYDSVDGSTSRFLSDFIIQSEQFARVYNYFYNAAGVEGDIDVGTGLPTRVEDFPNASEDLITLDKWDLVDNSILFYTNPPATSSVWIEIATTPEEFGDTLAAPIVVQAEAARDAAELFEWEAEAEALTAESYATEVEDTFVNDVTSDGDGTFTYTPTTNYSSLHWAAKATAEVTPFLAHIADTTNPHSVTQTQVGLSNVDNTSDVDKPVSTAQQTALDLKANLASPALTGTPTINGNNVSGLSGVKNKIINGDGRINQREYVSGTATTGANEYTLDRWRVVTSGQNLTFSTTENVTTFTVPVGGIEQEIDGDNIFSGIHAISFVATGDVICTVNGQAKTNGGIFTATGGANYTVKFTSALGTGTVKLIQVEYGTVATHFEQRPIGMELSLCQRYLPYRSKSNSTGVHGQGLANATTVARIIVPFAEIARIIPTAISYSGNLELWDGVSTFAVTGLTIISVTSTDRLVTLQATVASGLTQFRMHHLRNASDATAYIEIQTEL